MQRRNTWILRINCRNATVPICFMQLEIQEIVPCQLDHKMAMRSLLPYCQVMKDDLFYLTWMPKKISSKHFGSREVLKYLPNFPYLMSAVHR